MKQLVLNAPDQLQAVGTSGFIHSQFAPMSRPPDPLLPAIPDPLALSLDSSWFQPMERDEFLPSDSRVVF